MDERLHWVMADHDEFTVCGKRAEDGVMRTSNLELGAIGEACANCETLWARYSTRVIA